MADPKSDVRIYFGFKPIIPGYDPFKEAFKKGLALFKAGHVLNVCESTLCEWNVITSKVVRQTSVSLPPYDVKIQVNCDRQAFARECTCAAGAGGRCKHIGATVAYINNHSGASKTDLPQQWGKPSQLQSLREQYTHGKSIEALFPPPPKSVLEPVNINIDDLDAIPCAFRDILACELRSEGDCIVTGVVSSIIDNVIQIVQDNECRKVMWEILDLQLMSLSIGKTWDEVSLSESEQRFFESKVRNNPGELVDISINTVTQSSCPQWMDERAVRISASSKAHKIKTRKRILAEALAKSFIDPKPFQGNAATRYGNKMEGLAIAAYLEEHRLDGLKVVSCGLIIREPQPWLCASPDGIVVIEGKVQRLLEVKCPYKCSKLPIVNEDGTSNVVYIAQSERGTYVLKESHIDFTQVQMQLYCTGLNECDFYVYSPKQAITVNVKRNNEFLMNIIRKLEEFYFVNYLPSLVEKYK